MITYSELIEDAKVLKNLCLNRELCVDCPAYDACHERTFINETPSCMEIEEIVNRYIYLNPCRLIFELIISRNNALLPNTSWQIIHTEMFVNFSDLLRKVSHTKAFDEWSLDFVNKLTAHNSVIDGGVLYEYNLYLEREE